MRRAFGLALMPVTQIMGADHANRPRHADKGAKPDKGVFDDSRGFEAAMDQQAVHSHRMAGADGHGRQSEKDQQGVKLWIQQDSGDPGKAMPEQPERFDGHASDAALKGRCFWCDVEAVG